MLVFELVMKLVFESLVLMLLGLRLSEVVCRPIYDQLMSSRKHCYFVCRDGLKFCQFAKKQFDDLYLQQEKAPVPGDK